MICYRDITFCNAPCSNRDCQMSIRVLDAEPDKGRLERSGLPISVMDRSSTCDFFVTDDDDRS